MTVDLEELLELMHDRPAGQMVRCSKARAMFAMRACRKSIMIGTALNKRQMTSVSRRPFREGFELTDCGTHTHTFVLHLLQVVQHMGTMDQHWHCPHECSKLMQHSLVGRANDKMFVAIREHIT